MHKLLSRQLQSCQGAEGALEIGRFIALVNSSYRQADRDRSLTIRSSALMEEELVAAHQRASEIGERYLKTILDTVGEGVLIIGRHGTVVDANAAAEVLFGFAAGEMVGVPLDGVIRNAVLPLQGIRRDGTVFPVEVVSGDLPQMGSGQQVWIMRDISERVRHQQELEQRESRFRDFAESSSDWFWESDAEHRFTLFLGPANMVDEVLRPQVIGRTRMELMQDTCSPEQIAAHERDLDAHRPFRNFAFQAKMPGGRMCILSVSGKPIFNDDGTFKGYRGTTTDISERHDLLDQLEMAASVFANTMEAIMVTDPAGVIQSVNQAFTDITGFTAAEAVGKTPRLLRSNRHGPEFYDQMWAALNKQGWWRGEIWNRRKSGEFYLQWSTITTIRDDTGIKRFVAVFSDITESRRKDERIQFMAYHDELTGLANRNLLHDRMEHAIASARRDGSLAGLMLLDIDHFKYVNDSLGHEAGDTLLRQLAERLQSFVRRTDTVARMGGDEFMVVLDNPTHTDSVAPIASKLAAAIALPFEIDGLTLHVTVSIGISLFPQDAEDAGTLMKNADTAMYAAKTHGRNCFRFFDPAMNSRAMQRLNLEADLRRGLRNNQFELFYQPKILLNHGGVGGAEALVRWRHPQRGLVMPDEFIPLAEESGLIHDLGEYVFDAACRQRALWQKAYGADAPVVAVNVSALQLRQGDRLVQHIGETLKTHGVNGHGIEVELTESAVMSNPDEAIRSMSALKDNGLTIAIDDFGTGYSSLSYLKKLPIDTLKIDRSFVSDIEHDEDDAEIVKVILGLGRSLRLNMVAEGVESQGQARMLAEWGCHSTQGYYYARPMPSDEFERWFKAY